MKQSVLALSLLMASGSMFAASTYLDLQTLFHTDVFLESGGAGLGNALDADGRRVDSGTLPLSYPDGSPIATQDGGATFKFGNFKQSSLDGAAINGQSISVQAGQYASLDLALLAAPQAFGNPFGVIEFHYADGSKDTNRFGPVAGWFNSPMAFDHTLYRFTDSSQVQTLASFRTDFGDVEANYLVQSSGNGNSGGNRFVDGQGYALYRIGDLGTNKTAKLGVTVGNNFVISLATEFHDPSVSTTDGFTVVANSMVIYNGVDHHNLANLKQYDIDLAPFLASGTGEIYILFTDASPNDGWGPYIQQILLYRGTPRTFEQVLEPVVDATRATLYAMFKTGTDAEKPFLYDNSGSGPSNRGHRFADGTGSLTYRFDLPAAVTNANLVIDMANNFVVSLSGASEAVTYFNMAAGSPEEATFLVDAGGSAAGSDYRFADGSTYMVYQFDLPDDATTAFAKVRVGNEFVIEAAAGTNGQFKVEKDWVAETGQETHDSSNLDFYFVNLSAYLTNNPTKVVRLRLSDGVPSDGWGPFLKSIAIVNSTNAASYQVVLDSQTLYGEDIRDEYNKKYYTLDLASVLANNPKKQFSVKFTDGSPSDGWGPGIFWMAVYSGELGIQSDQLVFNNLKTTLGDPQNYGLDFLQRRYPLNSSKTLSSIVWPAQPAAETNSIVYLLAATLNAPPALRILLQPDKTVRFFWTTNDADYVLQATANLVSPQWMTVTASSAVVGDQITVTQPVAGTRFYRLAK